MSGEVIDTIKTNALTVTEKTGRLDVKYTGKRGGKKHIIVDAVRMGMNALKNAIVAQEIREGKLVTYYNLYSEPELFIIEQNTEGKPDIIVLGDIVVKSIIMGD